MSKAKKIGIIFILIGLCLPLIGIALSVEYKIPSSSMWSDFNEKYMDFSIEKGSVILDKELEQYRIKSPLDHLTKRQIVIRDVVEHPDTTSARLQLESHAEYLKSLYELLKSESTIQKDYIKMWTSQRKEFAQETAPRYFKSLNEKPCKPAILISYKYIFISGVMFLLAGIGILLLSNKEGS
jgi:hypothetical protein